MNPVTHFLVSWSIANGPELDKRDRAAVTLAGIAPDLDAFGIVPELLTRGTSHPLLWWSDYHHVFGHNLFFGLAIAAVCLAVAKRKLRTCLLALGAFHVHLFCDIIGARGPDGCQWPIPYLYPVSRTPDLVWSGQWHLNSWPNFVITGVFLALMFYLAWKRGYSPLEMISARADKAFVETLRRRFPRSGNSQA